MVLKGGGAISLNAVKHSIFNNVEFLSNRVNSNDSQNSAQGGAVVIFNQFEDELTNTFFINCIFENNGIINEANQGSAHGGVFYINSGSRVAIVQSEFTNNFIQVQGGSSSFANAALVAYYGSANVQSWNDVAPLLSIRQSFIANNTILTDGGSNALLIDTNVPLDFVNNLVVNNRDENSKSYSLFQQGANKDQGGASAVSNYINNTIYANQGGINYCLPFW